MSIEALNTSKLKVGDCINNYKELCKLVEQPVCTGNQKRSQLEEFKRFFDYEKIGIKFIILDIYDNPIPKTYKYPVNAIYVKYIECILLKFLSKQPEYEVNILSQNLWLQLGMINHNFITMQFEKQDDLLELDSNMTYFEISDFYKRCRQKFSKIAKDSLDSLQNRCLINYRYIYWVKSKNEFEYREATKNEERYILKAQRKALQELGLENKSQVYLKNKSKAFYELRDKYVKEFIEIEKVFDCWNIIYNRDNVLEALSDDEIKLQKLMLNNEIINTVNKQAQNIYDKNKNNWKKLLEIDGECFCYPEEYVEMQNLLSDKLLKIKQ